MIPRDTKQAPTAAAARTVSSSEILAAAAHSLILGRCRHVYTHELRGALNSSLLAVELLRRSAVSAAKNPALLEQSSTLAKRAMGMLDKSTVELFHQILIADDPPGIVNIGTLLEEILRLLRPDLDIKAIVFQFTTSPDVAVHAPACKLRLLLLGIIAMTIDQLSEATEFSLLLMRDEGKAVIEMHANIDFPRIDTPEMLLATGPGSITPYALILVAARQWFEASGGGLELQQSVPSRMRVHLPLDSTQAAPDLSNATRNCASPGDVSRSLQPMKL